MCYIFVSNSIWSGTSFYSLLDTNDIKDKKFDT